MVAEFQFLCYAGRLLDKPKPFKDKKGRVCGLLLFANQMVDAETGDRTRGPALPVVLRGAAAEADMPIWTAVKGCGVCIIGKVIRYGSRKGPVTAIDSWYANILSHPMSHRYAKFADSPSMPEQRGTPEFDELDTFIPDVENDALIEALAANGAAAAEAEKEHTEGLLMEIVINRLMTEGAKALKQRARVVKRKRAKKCE